MMAYDMAAGNAAQGYRSNVVIGLSDKDMLLKGIHGIVIHIKRATMSPINDAGARSQRCTRHLAEADKLVTFMIGITDAQGILGDALLNCYTSLQQLITRAIFAAADEVDQAITDALEQARLLEASVSTALGETHHG